MGHVLLIDDDPVVHSILDACLRDTGLRLRSATSGAAGLEMVVQLIRDQERPRAIFLDNMLGDMHAAEVLAELRRIASAPELPVILLSANAEADIRALYPGITVERFLQKPFVAADIRRVLESVGALTPREKT